MNLYSKRLNLVSRQSTMTKPIIAPVLTPEIGLTFCKDINEVVNMYEILAGQPCKN